MRVLVTGAAGFIGSHLIQRLCARGHQVFGLARPANNASAQSKSRLASFDTLANFQWIEGSQNFTECIFDACVHLAGRSSVRESLNNPGLYEFENCRFSLELLEALRRCGCKRVIHASTVMIYGKGAPLPYRENAIGSTPASFYGASKLAVEAAMNTWRVLHGMETFNLRFFSVYGPELRPDCVPHLIASAIENNAEFTVLGDGSSVRDYIEIEDVLDAIEAALQVPWNTQFPTALNIGTGVGTRLSDLIKLIEQGMNKTARIVHKPAVAGELQAIVAGIQTAKEVLNWSPRVKIDDGMRRFAKWFTQRRRT